ARLHETGPRCPSGASQKSVAAAFAVVQAGTLPLLQPVSASSWPVCGPNRAGEDTPGTGNLSCEAYTKRATRSGRAGSPADVSAAVSLSTAAAQAFGKDRLQWRV